jgi:hypothetical protein
METEKKELLKEIEDLLSFDGKETSINPDYLAYFSVEELENIKQGLKKKHERMIEEHREWMRQFRKASEDI